MTLASLKTKANATLATFWTALQTRQDAYFAKHGKYFQLLVTSPVIDGADTTFEIIHPNDEKHLIDVDFDFASPIPFQIKVDEWVGDGQGYSATAIVELPNGDKYTRTHHSNGDDTNWSLVVPITI